MLFRSTSHIATNAIYTDESRLYGTVPGMIRNHNHETVHHAAQEWVRGDVHLIAVQDAPEDNGPEAK